MLYERTDIDQQLLQLARHFLSELKAHRATIAVHLDASLERELGIGSLEKAELISRVEKHFHVKLSEQLIRQAQTLRDFLDAIKQGKDYSRILTKKFAPILKATHVNPKEANTLVDVLKQYADHEPERPHIYFHDEDGGETTLCYGELYTQATQVAAGLNALNIGPNETVAIMLPTCLDFFPAFCGILLAGCIPVPIYPPFRPEQIESYIKREAGILNNAQIRVLITFPVGENIGRVFKALIPTLEKVTTVNGLSALEGKIKKTNFKSTQPALIQYTSGSTGDPKGVLLNYENLLANIRAYGQAIDVKSTDVCVSWLPLYHDMGLIGAWLGSFYHGIPLTLLTPLTFLTHPERWLWALHYHRGTLAASPNFGYELCIRKIEPRSIEGLDLSAWRIAANGAEIVRSSTLARFAKKFARYGFRKASLFPVYGLAESTVALTLPILDEVYKTDTVDRNTFQEKSFAQPMTETQKQTQTLHFVCCGRPLPNHQIRIVDSKKSPLPERYVGEIQFQGPSAFQEYFHRLKATQSVYHDGWYDTGDCGYIADGEIYITGRKKDIIIKAGRNFYPDDVESAVGEIDGIRKGCVVAFGVVEQRKVDEQFVIVAETLEKRKLVRKKIRDKIRQVTVDVICVSPDKIILTPPKTIPKTSSGKLRREECKALYLKHQLAKKPTAVWVQVLKIFFRVVLRKIKESIFTSLYFFYTIYCVALLSLHMGLLFLCLQFVKSKTTTRKYFQWFGRSFFCCIGIPIRIINKKYLSKDQPVIYVFNHASYIDAILVQTFLPLNTVILAKEELKNVYIFEQMSGKAGYMSIDRFDYDKGQRDLARLHDTIKNNESVAIFPEGTFTHATGIRPFKLGAFKLAVDTGTPICPVSLSGTRKLFRASQWLFKFSKIRVHINPPIKPIANDWNEVLRLRDLACQQIIDQSDEKSLNIVSAEFEHVKKDSG